LKDLMDSISMAYQGFTQATEALKRAKRTLIVAPENSTADRLAAMAALFAYLKAQGLEVDAFCPNLNIEKLPGYLPMSEMILPQLSAMRDFRISLKVDKTPVGEMAYDVKDGNLDIVLTPKYGEWAAHDLSFHQGEDRYDLIIALGCDDRNMLAEAFPNHADFIYRTPVINIDHDAKNEHWAAINLVDMTAGSVTEVLHSWFTEWNEAKIDEKIATALMAGMIWKTQSFKSASVTPKTLERASKLVSLGADREQVVHQLWRTRNINTLKLWGRALTRLEQDTANEMVWTSLSKQDILDSGTTEAKLDELVQELIAYAPDAKLVAIFVEHDENTTRGAIFAEAPHDAKMLGRALGFDGTREKSSGAIAKPVVEAKEHAITTLRAQLKK
jgi:nanoRNase/pAp phosphatase (c-di-AMP/oligoRNAs hydrolase)